MSIASGVGKKAVLSFGGVFFLLVALGTAAILASAAYLLPSFSSPAQAANGSVGAAGIATQSGGGIKAGTVPDEFVGLYVAAGATCPEVSPVLLAAQGRQESGFDPDAVSPVGARGIAQFMPATWAAYGNGGDVTDPADAIPAQARFMCALAKSVRGIPGDLTTNMLAGYNAGPGAVQRYNGVPPFSETQGYVSTIRRFMDEMRAPVVPGALAGSPVAAGQWVKPTDGTFTSGFGSRWGAAHNGIDLAERSCTRPIVAAAAGTVVSAGPSSGYGNLIIVSHGGGIFTRYAHMYPDGLFVRVGAVVGAGTVIAEMGSYGQSTGCHLHFEVMQGGPTPSAGGRYVDPVPFLLARGVRVR